MSAITIDVIEAILTERLEVARQEKATIREQIEALSAKIKYHKDHPVPSVKETEQQLNDAIRKLEYDHSTASQTSTDDKTFMKEIDKIKRKKKNIVLHGKAHAEFLSLKQKRDAVFTALREKENAIDELNSGLRKVKIAIKLGCPSADIVERVVQLDSNALTKVIGKGGTNLNKLETDTGTSIEIDKSGVGGVNIMGTESTVAACEAKIRDIMNSITEEFSVTENLVWVLLANKSAKMKEIERSIGGNLYVSVIKQRKVCKCVGNPTAVAAAKAMVLATEVESVRVAMDGPSVELFLSKQSLMHGLEKDFNIHVYLKKDKGCLELMGEASKVALAREKALEIMEHSKEVVETISADRHVLHFCVIGVNGKIARSLNKEFDVKVEVTATDPSEAGKGQRAGAVTIKGCQGKVIPARNRIIEMANEYVANMVSIEVAKETIQFVAGKDKTVMKAIRDKYPLATIDLDVNGEVINIHCVDDIVRDAVTEDIKMVVEDCFYDSLPLPDAIISELVKSKRADSINEFMKANELKTKFGNGAVKIAGSRLAVEQCIRMLQTFADQTKIMKVSVHEDDYPVLLKGSNQSIVRDIERKFGVTIEANKKDLALYIKGEDDAVAQTLAAINGFLSGDGHHRSLIVHVDQRVMSTLIGRGGSTISKMESMYSVKLDVMKSRNILRIYGAADDLLATAKAEIIKFLAQAKIAHVCRISYAKLSEDEMDELMKTTTRMFPVDITVQKSNELLLKGTLGNVEPAAMYITGQCNGDVRYALKILRKHIDIIGGEAMKTRIGENLVRMGERNGAKVSVDPATNSIQIAGKNAAVEAVKSEVLHFCELFFPNEVYSIDVPEACFQDLFQNDTTIVAIAEETQCNINIDRPNNRLILYGDISTVGTAKQKFKEKIGSWSSLADSVQVEPFHVQTFQKQFGKMNLIMMETNTKISINTSKCSIDFRGKSVEETERAKEKVLVWVEKVAAQHWESSIDGGVKMAAAIIGKKGATINKVRAESGAHVDFYEGRLKVTGKTEQVSRARELLAAIIAREEERAAGSSSTKSVTSVISLPSIAALAAITGPNRSTAAEIEKKSGCTLDIDRVSQKCVMKGSAEGIEEATELIQAAFKRENIPFVAGAANETSSEYTQPSEEAFPSMIGTATSAGGASTSTGAALPHSFPARWAAVVGDSSDNPAIITPVTTQQKKLNKTPTKASQATSEPTSLHSSPDRAGAATAHAAASSVLFSPEKESSRSEAAAAAAAAAAVVVAQDFTTAVDISPAVPTSANGLSSSDQHQAAKQQSASSLSIDVSGTPSMEADHRLSTNLADILLKTSTSSSEEDGTDNMLLQELRKNSDHRASNNSNSRNIANNKYQAPSFDLASLRSNDGDSYNIGSGNDNSATTDSSSAPEGGLYGFKSTSTAVSNGAAAIGSGPQTAPSSIYGMLSPAASSACAGVPSPTQSSAPRTAPVGKYIPPQARAQLAAQALASVPVSAGGKKVFTTSGPASKPPPGLKLSGSSPLGGSSTGAPGMPPPGFSPMASASGVAGAGVGSGVVSGNVFFNANSGDRSAATTTSTAPLNNGFGYSPLMRIQNQDNQQQQQQQNPSSFSFGAF